MNFEQVVQQIRNDVDEKTGQTVIPPGAIATKGYLRFDASLQQTGSSINFPVLKQGIINDVEQRLLQTDMFTVLNWGLFIFKAGTSATPSAVTQAQIAQSYFRTNPNALVFTTAGESAALMAIYNGNLSVTIDSTTIIPAFDCLGFYRVGQAQKGVGPVTITTDDQFDYNQGIVDVGRRFTMSGAGNNVITLNLPNATTTSGTASSNWAVLICRGVRWQNASKLSQANSR